VTTAYDVKAQPLIEHLKEDIREIVETPDWAKYSKSGSDSERVPEQDDWYQIRCASILRKLYLDGPSGVSSLRTYYGSRKDNGHGPEHHEDSSGKVIRTALQNLEENGLVETEEGEGRKITDTGRSLVDTNAAEVR
jgi:small subunit ribosomal protein S19e